MFIMINENYLLNYKRLCGLLLEDFSTQKNKFIQQGYSEIIVSKYLENFKLIKDRKYKQLFDNIDGVSITSQNRNNIDAYKTFHELETIVDYVNGQVDIKGMSLGSELEIDGKPIFDN